MSRNLQQPAEKRVTLYLTLEKNRAGYCVVGPAGKGVQWDDVLVASPMHATSKLQRAWASERAKFGGQTTVAGNCLSTPEVLGAYSDVCKPSSPAGDGTPSATHSANPKLPIPCTLPTGVEFARNLRTRGVPCMLQLP